MHLSVGIYVIGNRRYLKKDFGSENLLELRRTTLVLNKGLYYYSFIYWLLHAVQAYAHQGSCDFTFYKEKAIPNALKFRHCELRATLSKNEKALFMYLKRGGRART